MERYKERRCMIADAREMSMVRENRLFIVDARTSADTFRRCYRFQSYSSSGGMGTHMPSAAAGCE
jgi:hypothetical protein